MINIIYVVVFILLLIAISMITRRRADILHSVKAAGFSSDPDSLQVINNLMLTTLMTTMRMVTMMIMNLLSC